MERPRRASREEQAVELLGRPCLAWDYLSLTPTRVLGQVLLLLRALIFQKNAHKRFPTPNHAQLGYRLAHHNIFSHLKDHYQSTVLHPP